MKTIETGELPPAQVTRSRNPWHRLMSRFTKMSGCIERKTPLDSHFKLRKVNLEKSVWK